MDYTQTIPDPEPTVNTASAIELGLIGNGYNGRQILIDTINKKSTFKYWMEQGWGVTPPRKMPQNSKYNTICELVNNQKNRGLFSSRVVYYNRIHTSALSPLVIPKGSAVNVSDLLDAINAVYQTKILFTEIVDSVLPPADVSGNVTINLVFPEGTIQYYSGDITTLSTVNVFGITKADIGLALVDNTPDTGKPVSTPVLSFINNSVDNAVSTSEQYTRDRIAELNSVGQGEAIDGGNF